VKTVLIITHIHINHSWYVRENLETGEV